MIDKEFSQLSIVIALFILISLFLPIYDQFNGFHNLILDDYKLTWYDGRSPANFHIIKNMIENRSISFPEGYFIGNIQVENHYDFIGKDGTFYPLFDFLGNSIYAGILYFVPTNTELQLFKGMIALNILFSTVTLLFFYFIQRQLGLNTKYSLLSTFIAGTATSLFIYTRYIFIQSVIMNLVFVLLIYVILKNWKKKSPKIEIFTAIIFSIFLSFLWYGAGMIYFIVLSYFFIKYKFIRSIKVLIIPAFIYALLFLSLNLGLYVNIPPTRGFYLDIKNTSTSLFGRISNIVSRFSGIPMFRVFPKYINALDYSIYGYHDITSVWKLVRKFAYVYTFEEPKGNAIFLSFYGLFGSLFGPKGFIFNSPFLIFSILGIFAYKRNIERNLLLVIIVLIIITYGFLHLMWYGGVTPRYNRYLTIPALFLTFFSFYYIQETKNVLPKLIFLGLIILSVLNVVSLAVRADWTYEHEADLVSYDLVLWPWYPIPEAVTNVTNETTILLTSEEIPHWKLSGESPCKSTFGGMGLVTDTCYCAYDSWAERKIELERNVRTIEVKACSAIAGNDGTKGLIYIDDVLIGEIFIESNSCTTKTFSVNISPDIYTIKLKSGKYGKCNNEIVFWKSLKFE